MVQDWLTFQGWFTFCADSITACGLCKMSACELLSALLQHGYNSGLVDKGDIPEERKDNVKKVLHALGYAASRAVGKAFLNITKKDMTDAGMSIADANAILAEVESVQG